MGVIGGLLSNSFASEKVENVTEVVESGEKRKSLFSIYDFAVNDLLYMIWRWLVVGVLASAAITTWLPQGAISWSEISLILSLLLVLLISLPLYVCATSSVPIAAALVHSGMPTSAALVFLMAGPATNFATIGAVYKGFGLKNLIIYLGTIIFGSTILAFSFDYVLQVGVHDHAHHHGAVSGFLVYVLLFYFALFLYKDLKSLLNRGEAGDESIEFNVDGLKCQKCVKKLRGVLEEVSEISLIEIVLDGGAVKVSGSSLDKQKIAESIEKVGFQTRNLLS